MAEQRAPGGRFWHEDPALDADDEARWQAEEIRPEQGAKPLPTPELDAGAPEPVAAAPALPHSPAATAWLGLFGGLMVAYSAAWCVIVLTSGRSAVPQLLVGLWTAGLWAAVLAPLLWAGVVIWVTRSAAARWVAALLGIVVLFPLPLILTMIGATR